MSIRTGGIETRVDGSPDSVDAVATWLRASLRSGLDRAGDQLAAARSEALAGFRGQAGTSYELLAAHLLHLVDEHVARVDRATVLVTAYADRLRQQQQAMTGYRDQARAGGLTVTGTVILEPPVTVLGATGAPALYARLAAEVPAEHLRFLAWVEGHLGSAERDDDAEEVRRWVQLVREHLDALGRNLGQAYTTYTLEEVARSLEDRAADRERARTPGDPGRPPGRVPLDDIDGLRGLSRLADGAGRALGPVGTAIDGYGALESDEPAGGLIAVGLGAGVTAAVIVTAPASVPTLTVVAGGVAAGYLVTKGAEWGWGKLPDGGTDPADEWVEDRWDDTLDAASGTWKSVQQWF